MGEATSGGEERAVVGCKEDSTRVECLDGYRDGVDAQKARQAG